MTDDEVRRFLFTSGALNKSRRRLIVIKQEVVSSSASVALHNNIIFKKEDFHCSKWDTYMVMLSKKLLHVVHMAVLVFVLTYPRTSSKFWSVRTTAALQSSRCLHMLLILTIKKSPISSTIVYIYLFV
ncbi:hypothetical protein DICVIV_10341 [Dictyocaulus viviparus]|uniref:Uncharacterized protein n=1 Tax=Dictyocaulus viviparus TaxID=29172 RepID=A0A0D8XG33_DICVI|nr:hypothetical protein DICVIV_10341 [Dictyocaulus viviparus]